MKNVKVRWLTGFSGGGPGLPVTVVDRRCIGLGVGAGLGAVSDKSGVDLARSRDLGSVVDDALDVTLSISLSLSMIDFTISSFLDLALRSA